MPEENTTQNTNAEISVIKRASMLASLRGQKKLHIAV